MSWPTQSPAETLRRSEERSRALLEALPDLMFWIGRDGRFRDYWAPRTSELYAPPAEFMGRSIDEVLPPQVAAACRSHMERALAGAGIQTFEFELPMRNGPNDFEARVVLCGEDEVLVLVRDITDRKRAEGRLKLAQIYIDRATDAAFWIDMEGRIIYVNHAACRSLGYSREELLSMSISDVDANVPPDLWPAIQDRFASVGSLSFESHHRRKDGDVFPVEITANYIEHEGRILNCASVRDISERKTMQAKLLVADRMACVGTLAAGVAHEINNPLSYMVANMHYVADAMPAMRAVLEQAGVEVGEIEEAIAEALQGADRVRTIVRELKTFARADDDQRGLLDVHHVLEASIRMAFNEIRHRASLARDLGPVPRVSGNESKLGQVFLNLLMNAAQAIPEGDPAGHEIRVTTRTGSWGEAIVEVRDTGCGIPASIVHRIFDPFFTTKPVGEGTGLGLSVCHGIVARMGGQIAVESEPGQGALFRVSLPSATATPPPAPAPRDPAPPRRGRILVVDDEPMIGRSVARVLGPAQDVVSITDAREALALIGSGERFDVLLCDLSMPGMTGIDLHAEISRVAPEMLPRMVFLTCGAFTPRAREFLDSVECATVSKPFDAEALLALVAARVR